MKKYIILLTLALTSLSSYSQQYTLIYDSTEKVVSASDSLQYEKLKSIDSSLTVIMVLLAVMVGGMILLAFLIKEQTDYLQSDE